MKKLFITGLFYLLVLNSNAQDRIFNYVYQSNVLNKGLKELEIWNTFSWQKSEFYRGFDHRLEFEMGLSKNLQTSFYLNINTSSEYTIGKKLVLKNSVVTEENDTSITTGTEFSFSNEWKYKLSDPVANVIGSALYAEIGLGTRETELEVKLILDKQLGHFSTALNLVGVYGIGSVLNNGIVEDETEFGAEINYGLSYQLGTHVHLGVEANSLNDFKDGKIENSVLFAGPVLSLVKDNFWINLTIFPQITAFKGASDGGLNLTDHSKIESRLLFSYAF
jgi:hypothetical protein